MQSGWKSLPIRLILLLAVQAVFGCVESSLNQAIAKPSSQSDQMVQLRELAERAFTSPYNPGPSGQMTSVKFLPGQLPASLPLQLPVPPAYRIVGSTVLTGFNGINDKSAIVSIYLDAPGAAADVLAFYERELSAKGWKVSPLKSGFEAGPLYGRIFCQNSTERANTAARSESLVLNVVPTRSGSNDVRINLNPTSPCAKSSPSRLAVGSRQQSLPGENLIPPLLSPVKTLINPNGGGGGSNDDGMSYFTSNATIDTNLSGSELEAYFAQQLQAAGWKRVEGRNEAPLAWSTWTVPGPGGEWQGFLSVLQRLRPNHYVMTVRVESATAPFNPVTGSPAPRSPVPRK